MAKARPERTCVGCRGVKPKGTMLRIVRGTDGAVNLDPAGKSEGRGVYICRSEACLEGALKRKALDRGLKGHVPPEVIDKARQMIAGEP